MVAEIAQIPLPGHISSTNGGDDSAISPVSLDRFFAGPENALVEVAVQSVLSDRSCRFNPLMVCGPSGTGKSHLACGLAAQWRSLYRSRVICVTAKEFARELADAFEVNSVVEFRKKYRECSLLTVEDLQLLGGRSAAQIELLHTLDDLRRRGSQMVLTASTPPARLNQLHPTLASRLGEGLVLTLSPPGVEVRTTLLCHLAQRRRVALSEPVARIVAEGVRGPIPQLMTAFAELESAARLDNRGIDADFAREYVRRRNEANEPQLSAIAIRTARYFSLKLGDLRGPSRRRSVVTARDVAMYLARMLTRQSLEQIGQYFGGRDHTTVLHGCRKTVSLLKTDPTVEHAVELLGSHWRKAW